MHVPNGVALHKDWLGERVEGCNERISDQVILRLLTAHVKTIRSRQGKGE